MSPKVHLVRKRRNGDIEVNPANVRIAAKAKRPLIGADFSPSGPSQYSW